MIRAKKFFSIAAFSGIFVFFLISVYACSTEDVNGGGDNTTDVTNTIAGATLLEGFEQGSKSGYTAADVTLSSGVWNLDDALIGNTAGDVRSGKSAVRVRNSGKVTMKFDMTNGVAAVEIFHAKYGTDGNSTWELWSSSNGGSSWSQVGSAKTTSSSTLSSAVFTVNKAGAIRFEIRKTDGGVNRINFDQIAMSDYKNGGGGTQPSGVHLTMGNPTGAKADVAFPTNYLMEISQYAMSYHRDKAIPNWVSWHLNSSWIGTAQRQDNFRSNPALPSGWYQVGQSSYSGSGFDRGHLCPSADRTATTADNSATFFMTNMMPQAPDNNEGVWARLEDYCRTLAGQGNELYIIAGSYGQGGKGSNGGTTNTLDGGKIWVPARTWKVILVIPNGDNDVNRVMETSRVIAVDIPNQQGVRSTNWGTFRVTVDAIETATGYDILSAVPKAIQTKIEAKVDNGPTQ